MTDRRFALDREALRFPGVLIGGSPPTLFRVTPAGDAVLDRIELGVAVRTSRLTDSMLDAGAIHPLPDRAGRRFDDCDVTVVVPTLGPPRHVPGRPGDVIVVDDGSVPPVDGATVRLRHNAGPAAARNAGLERVTTPLVAFVDADVEVPDGWLDGLLGHFDDPRVALVAPRVQNAMGTSALARHDATDGPLDLGTTPARVRRGSRVGYVPAAAIVCRVAALRAVGGFDPTLRFGEDVDLVWRLDDAGWRCRYEPTATVTHLPRPDWRGWIRQRIGYGSSAAPLAVRHPDALAPLMINGWSLASWVLPLTGRPALGVVTGLGSAAALIRKLPGVPAWVSLQFGLRGNLLAGDHIARSIRRAYWPLVAVAALRSRAARRALVAAAVAARSPVRLADDLTYSVGVWLGMAECRTAIPLRPRLTTWPPRAAQGARNRRPMIDAEPRGASGSNSYRPRA